MNEYLWYIKELMSFQIHALIQERLRVEHNLAVLAYLNICKNLLIVAYKYRDSGRYTVNYVGQGPLNFL